MALAQRQHDGVGLAEQGYFQPILQSTPRQEAADQENTMGCTPWKKSLAMPHSDVLSIPFLSNLAKGELKLRLHGERFTTGDLADIKTLWSLLLATATHSNVTVKHMTAACNVCCVFLENAISSSNPEMKAFAWSEKTWFESFGIVSEAFQQSKVRPGMQVLQLLARMIHEHPDQQYASLILTRVVDSMVGVILLSHPQHQMKLALTTLNCFMRKSLNLSMLLSIVEQCRQRHNGVLARRLKSMGVRESCVTEGGDINISVFILALFSATNLHDSRTPALRLFSKMYQLMIEADLTVEPRFLVWRCMDAYTSCIPDDDIALDGFIREVFSLMFSTKPEFIGYVSTISSRNTVNPSYSEPGHKLPMVLAALQAGRTKNLFAEDGTTSDLRTCLTC